MESHSLAQMSSHDPSAQQRQLCVNATPNLNKASTEKRSKVIDWRIIKEGHAHLTPQTISAQRQEVTIFPYFRSKLNPCGA